MSAPIRINHRPVTFSMRGLKWLRRWCWVSLAICLVAVALGADRADNIGAAGLLGLVALLSSDLQLCYVGLGSAADSSVARIDLACPNCGQRISTSPPPPEGTP